MELMVEFESFILPRLPQAEMNTSFWYCHLWGKSLYIFLYSQNLTQFLEYSRFKVNDYFLVGINTNAFSFSLSVGRSNFLRNHLRDCDGQHLEDNLLVAAIPNTEKAPSNFWAKEVGHLAGFHISISASIQLTDLPALLYCMCCYFPHITGSKLSSSLTPFISFTFSITYLCFLCFPDFINSANIY